MRNLLLAAALAFASPALAQVSVRVELPSIVFPAPPALVLVEPGVQVVDNYDEEVFFVDGFYWHHRGPHWYRTNAYTGGWVLVEPRFVPERIVFYEPGRFRHWHGSDDQRREWRGWQENRGPHKWREERREDRREDRREERRDDRRDDRREGPPGGHPASAVMPPSGGRPPPGGTMSPAGNQPVHPAVAPLPGPPGKGKGKDKGRKH